MIKKTLPLCVVFVMMVAGVAQATEWPHVSFTLPTDTWGDLTFHQTDLDQVGNNVTTGGNTYALDGNTNWSSELNAYQFPGQWMPRTPAYEADYQGKMDAAAYVLQCHIHADHSQIVTEIPVAEGAYDVFLVYLSIADGIYGEMHTGTFASTSLTGPLAPFKYDSGEIVDTNAVPGQEFWNAYVAKVGTVIGSTVTLRASYASDDGSESFGQSLTWGVCIRPAFKEIVVEPTAVEITEGDVAANVTVALTDEPDSDVTVTVTPGVHGLDYALNTEDPNDPVDLVFTPADWAAKTLTITPVDDVEIEDYREEDQLALSITTSDPCYAALVLPAIDVDIIDNEGEYVPTTYPVNTQTWGDITVHHVDLDQVGNDITPGGNTRAANGIENWVCDLGGPREYDWQWYTRPEYCTDVFTGQLEPAPYAMVRPNWGGVAPQLITEVDVPEDTYDVFVVYSAYSSDIYGTLHSRIYASTSETGPLTLFTWTDGAAGIGGEMVDPGDGGDPTWKGYVAQVGQVTGSQLLLRVSRRDENNENASGQTNYLGIGYRKSPWKVTESSGSTAVSENGATDTIEFQLMVEPASDVTVDVAVDAAQLTVDPNQLVFPVATWDTPLSVTVGAVDDAVVETDPHYSVLTYASDQADPNDALAGGTNVEIAENDCGAWGFHSMDFNQDCGVDLEDLALFAAQYLYCTRPDDPACIDAR